MKKQQMEGPEQFGPNRDKKTDPIKTKEEVAQNPDNKIDQDFPGFPHSPASEKIIDPKTKNEHLSAGTINKTDADLKNQQNNTQSEIDSDGSANAFERTEIPEPVERKKKDDGSNY